MSPDDHDAQVGLAAALRGSADAQHKDRIEEARSLLEKVLANDPHDTNALFNLGVLYADFLKRPGDAAPHFKRFLSDAPSDHPAARRGEPLRLGCRGRERCSTQAGVTRAATRREAGGRIRGIRAEARAERRRAEGSLIGGRGRRQLSPQGCPQKKPTQSASGAKAPLAFVDARQLWADCPEAVQIRRATTSPAHTQSPLHAAACMAQVVSMHARHVAVVAPLSLIAAFGTPPSGSEQASRSRPGGASGPASATMVASGEASAGPPSGVGSGAPTEVFWRRPACGTAASGAASGSAPTPLASGVATSVVVASPVGASGAATSAPLSAVELPGCADVSSELPQAAAQTAKEASEADEKKAKVTDKGSGFLMIQAANDKPRAGRGVQSKSPSGEGSG